MSEGEGEGDREGKRQLLRHRSTVKGVSWTCLWASVGRAFFCWRELSEEVNPGMLIFHALSGV